MLGFRYNSIMEEDKMLMLIGFTIVIVVALNVALVFSDMFTLGGGLQMISGFAVAECQNTVGGIECGDNTFAVKSETGCASDLVSVCTNACELERAQIKDDRICPSYCTDFCLPQTVAEDVLNTKQNLI